MSAVHPQVAASTALRARPTQEQVEADPMAQLRATRGAMVAAVPQECGPPIPVARVSDVAADGLGVYAGRVAIGGGRGGSGGCRRAGRAGLTDFGPCASTWQPTTPAMS